MGVLDALLDDPVAEAFSAPSGPTVPRYSGAAAQARRVARSKGLTPGSRRITPKITKGPEDEDFEKKHPRGKKGTPEGGKFVKKGSSGADVRAVQAAVGAREDGKFGRFTESAVRRFQRQHGLVVDGKVGHQTALALAGRFEAAKRANTGRLTDQDRRRIAKAGKRARSK